MASKDPILCPEALPCPFCGEAPIIVGVDANGPRKRMIKCANEACGAKPGVPGPNRQWTVKRWNHRAGQTRRDDAAATILQHAGITACMEVAEALPNVERGSVEIDFSMTSSRSLTLVVRARMVHRTRRGPVRVGGVGSTFDEAIADLSQRVDIENDRADARAARGAA